MSEQDGTQTSIKRRKSSRTSKQNGTEATTLRRPANDDKDAWIAYWRAQGQEWRTEPEIAAEQQKYLAERRGIESDIEQGIYPFKDIKLSRADVEWLLATHDNGRGPVDWSDESQRGRKGLDLRGADLQKINLKSLPLTGIYGGLPRGISPPAFNKYPPHQYYEEAQEQYQLAAIHLEEADLSNAHLEGVQLSYAVLDSVKLSNARLEGAILNNAHLKRAHLDGACLERTHLDGAYLEGAFAYKIHLEGAYLSGAHLEGAYLNEAHLEGAYLNGAHLEGAYLSSAHLEGAFVYTGHLEEASLSSAHLEGVNLFEAHLEGAILSEIFVDSSTKLNKIFLANKQQGVVSLADVHWRDVNIAVVDWSKISKLGDESTALQRTRYDGRPKTKLENLDGFRTAVRAYRQLSIVLRNQGLNEDAARFAYRAQMLQRTVFRLKGGVRSVLQYFFSLFLDLLAGYGYKPWRSFLAYLLVITASATAYFVIGHTIGPVLSPLGSFVFSMTSFHGRGFFPGGIQLDDPLTVLAALEAFVGLLIEVTFIATLTQRLFGK